MNWKIEYLEEAKKDLRRLDHSVRIRVIYKLEFLDGIMKMMIVSIRDDDYEYEEAYKRRSKHKM